MPKPLRYADVYTGLQDGSVEEREHGGLYSFTPRMGRTSALVDCPFCGRGLHLVPRGWREAMHLWRALRARIVLRAQIG